MPAHKRHSPSENLLDDEDEESLQQHHGRRKKSRREDEEEEEEETEPGHEPEEQPEEEDSEEDDSEERDEEEDSDGSRLSDDVEKLPEWVPVDLSIIRINVRCPICLGIIKKTRTMMDCLHRFCRECIDKSMRLGNNECPACRKHCASRRSLRDDPRFDSFIDSLYDDVEKYEEEELAFHEDEKTRNKQIQASIAKISQKQSEVQNTKRNKVGKDAQCVSNTRRKYTRRKRRNEPEESEDNEDEDNHNGNKESSSADERRSETKQRRYRKRAPIHQASPSAAHSDGAGNDNEVETSNKEGKGTPCPPKRSPELFAWGRAGARSKCFRKTRLTKLNKYLENQKENDPEMSVVHLMLISTDGSKSPWLQQWFLRCPPHFTIGHLKECVASEIRSLPNNIDVLLVKKNPSINELEPALVLSTSTVQILEGQETLAEARTKSALDGNHLVLACQLKEGN